MKKIQYVVYVVPEYDMKLEGTYKFRISPAHLRNLWKMN